MATSSIRQERRPAPSSHQTMTAVSGSWLDLDGCSRGCPAAVRHPRSIPQPAESGQVVPSVSGWHAWEDAAVTAADDRARHALVRRGFALEYATLAWNVVGVVVLAIAAVSARSVALAGFGLDSLIDIGASAVVIWELSGTGERRQQRGLRLIGCAFAALAVYLLVQSTVVLVTGYHPRQSVPGIVWTAAKSAVMFALAAGKARTGRALGNPVLRTEGRLTMIDGILAAAVLLGLVLNAGGGWWWADPVAGYVLVFYAVGEVREIFFAGHWGRAALWRWPVLPVVSARVECWAAGRASRRPPVRLRQAPLRGRRSVGGTAVLPATGRRLEPGRLHVGAEAPGRVTLPPPAQRDMAQLGKERPVRGREVPRFKSGHSD